jgi:pimeloyl-ACP methyl ester carboxylesterase
MWWNARSKESEGYAIVSWTERTESGCARAVAALLMFALANGALAQPDGATSPAPAVSAANSDLREEFVEDPIFGGRVYLQQRGIGRPQTVVFVHGIGDNGARDWNNIIPAVSRNFHTIAFDLPGFGRSDKGNETYSPRNYARFVNWIIMTYAKSPVILIGHSMGGAVSLYYTAEYPQRVRRLILVDAAGILHRTALLKFLVSFPAYTESDNPAIRRSATNVSTWLARAIERSESLSRRFGGLIDETRVRRMFIEDTPTTIAGAELMETDFSTLVPKVTVPTYIIWGERDQIAPVRTGQVLAELLPRAELVTIPEAAHVPMNETPERARELIEARLSMPDIAARKPAAPPVIKDDAPTLTCKDERDKSYTGTYSRIEITRCVNVDLKDIVAREVVISDSTVSMLNAQIAGDDVAIKLEATELLATNLRVSGKVAFRTTLSRLDLAGAEISGTAHAVENELTSSLVCSLCRVKSGAKAMSWHDVFELKPSTRY